MNQSEKGGDARGQEILEVEIPEMVSKILQHKPTIAIRLECLIEQFQKQFSLIICH